MQERTLQQFLDHPSPGLVPNEVGNPSSIAAVPTYTDPVPQYHAGAQGYYPTTQDVVAGVINPLPKLWSRPRNFVTR